jgi:hypothetical protein
MKRFSSLSSIFIFVLCAIILFQKCEKDKVGNKEIIKVEGKPYEVIKHEIDTLEIVKTKIEYRKGDSIPYEVLVHDTLYKMVDVDTMGIIKKYFSTLVYKDTLKLDDSLGTIVIIDTITENKIKGRVIQANVKERIIKDLTIVKELPKAQVYIGANASFNRVELLNSVGGGFIYKTKQDKLYQITIGAANSGAQITPYLGFGMYWKISLKK